MSAIAETTAPAVAVPARGRIASIDILRGLTILWIMVYHLWGDQTHAFAGSQPLYEAFRDRLSEGRPWPALTALFEVVAGSGYQGVIVFMMLSGISLTMNAYRRGEPPALRGYASRFRKLLIPYWAGTMIIVATIAVIALIQAGLDGGSFGQQWDKVTLQQSFPVKLRLEGVLQSLSVAGDYFRETRTYIPSAAALWFVPLLMQYYLAFPLLLRLLKRVGPWRFLAITTVLLVLAREIALHYATARSDPFHLAQWENEYGLLRGFEFTFGMALGYLLVNNFEQVREWTATISDVAGLLVLGALLQLGGSVMTGRTHFMGTFSFPVLHLGLALLLIPLLFKQPGRFEASAPARALSFLGVVAFTALIVNESMRFVSSFLQYEGVPDAVWWFFIVVVYIPGGTLLAYPLAKLLGLLPKQRAANTEIEPAPPPGLELQAASGG